MGNEKYIMTIVSKPAAYCYNCCRFENENNTSHDFYCLDFHRLLHTCIFFKPKMNAKKILNSSF